ncbi:MAG: glucosamine-6-phosphate deaminase [Eubacteriales bacterium]
MLTENRIVVCKDYAEMSRRAADVFADYIRENPNGILGLATGSSPEGIYACLIDDYKAGKLDFSGIKSYNLDEYYPIEPTHEQSYRRFMDEHLFDHVNINKENTFVPNGLCKDADSFCAEYDAKIAAAGGIGIQLLGVGRNGHIGFNEPGDALIGATHLTSLCESTIDANSRFFAGREDVPRHAITMGLDGIMSAECIVLVVSGKEKHDALMALLSGKYTTNAPVTLLRSHKNVYVFCDEDAYRG